MFSISNAQSIMLSNYNSAGQIAKDSYARLSSGQNFVKDDPVRMMNAVSASAHAEGLRQANKNIQDGVSMVQVAQEGYKSIREGFQEARSIFVKLSDDTLSSNERKSFQKQLEGVATNIWHTVMNTKFNGKNVLSGEYSNGVRVQTGDSASDFTMVKFADVVSNLQSFNQNKTGMGDVKFNSVEADEAHGFIGEMDNLIDATKSAESNLAFVEKTLTNRASSNGRAAQVQQNYADRIQTVDEAREMAKMAAANLRQEMVAGLIKTQRDHENMLVRMVFGSF